MCSSPRWAPRTGLVQRSQVGGEEGADHPLALPMPTLPLPQNELQRIRLSFERKKMAITEVPTWLGWEGLWGTHMVGYILRA